VQAIGCCGVSAVLATMPLVARSGISALEKVQIEPFPDASYLAKSSVRKSSICTERGLPPHPFCKKPGLSTGSVSKLIRGRFEWKFTKWQRAHVAPSQGHYSQTLLTELAKRVWWQSAPFRETACGAAWWCGRGFRGNLPGYPIYEHSVGLQELRQCAGACRWIFVPHRMRCVGNDFSLGASWQCFV
jgi:hypothetical protein